MDKKTKILIVTSVKFELNGITNVILNYYKAMDKTDMQIDFVVPNEIKKELRKEIEKNNGKIFVIKERNKRPISYISNLYRIIKQEGYDIVHAHGNSTTLTLEMYAAKKASAPVRISHSHSSSSKHKIIHKLLRHSFEKNYTHALACGEEAGKWLYGNKFFKIVTNGINIKKFTYNEKDRENYRETFGLTEKKVIGHIGHFIYPKNHSYLIDVFFEMYKKDHDYRLLLIGDGPLKKEIKKKVKEYNISDAVIFAGTRKDIPQLMSVMDYYVLPSHFEGLPLSVMEAQASCLPCIVSSNVSKEIKTTKLVQFISPDDSPKKWAEKIANIDLMNRAEQTEEVQQNIINAGYSISENGEKLRELYLNYSQQEKKTI